MKVTFLGGSNEVGASSSLVEMDGRKILIDCGIRMSSDKDPIPDLAPLKKGALDAFLLTHAHLDHTGAAPLIHAAYPRTPIYTTPASIGLIDILLRDSLKIMKEQEEKEREIPLYSLETVNSMLATIQPIHFGFPKVLFDSVQVTFFPAGHILGAASIFIRGREGSILVSGDISVTSQISVAGMPVPPVRPDVVIMESTYGTNLHANREVEERKLVEKIATVILEQQGKVLIPAFALGRAQEIILSLLKAFQKRELPDFPVYVDGMVRNICLAYTQHPKYVTPYLQKKILKFGDPFFGAVEQIRRVVKPADREKIVRESPPCCIVSSSGMLTGGPSQYYARELAGNERNLIAITGYQDEEAPGRQLLALQAAAERTLTIEGKTVEVRAAVEKYSLSAHADGGQIAGLIAQLKASDVLLVHGEDSARAGLADMLKKDRRGRIYLPINGDELEFTPHQKNRPRERAALLPQEGLSREPFSPEGAEKLYAFLVERFGCYRSFSVHDLFLLWAGDTTAPASVIESFENVLMSSIYFESDRRRAFLYRPISQEKLAESLEKLQKSGILEQNLMLSRVDEFFTAQDGLYKKGLNIEEHIVILYFDFPEVAERRFAGRITDLVDGTGWRVSISPNGNQQAFELLARRLLPKALILVRSPAIHLEKKEVILAVQGRISAAEQDLIERQFWQESGFTLFLKEQLAVSSVYSEKRDGNNKMEINSTYALISDKFAGAAHLPYKKSKKSGVNGEFIELSFISPEIGSRYQDRCREIERLSGWSLDINKEPNQNDIIKVARQLIRPEWQLQKVPSFLKAERKIKVKLGQIPDATRWQEAQSAFLEQTGYQLEMVV
jgi:Cft2 family RNA processing exonuclease